MFRQALWVLLLSFTCPFGGATAATSAPNGEEVILYVTLYPVIPPREAPQYCATPTSDEQRTAAAGDTMNLCFIVRNQSPVVLNHHEIRRDGALIRTVDFAVERGNMQIVFEERLIAVANRDASYTVTSYAAPGGTPYTATARLRLTTRQPRIALSQNAFDVQTSVGSISRQLLTISNSGQGLLAWNLGESNSAGNVTPIDTIVDAPNTSRGATALLPAYAITQDAGQQNYIAFDLAEPLVSVPVPAQLSAIRAGTFVDNDFSKQFLLSNSNGLLTVNTTTGQTSVINAATQPLPGEAGWTGMAWDPLERMLYGLSATNDAATVYRIDPATGVTFRLGAINVLRRALRGVYAGIAVDADGRIYAIDTSNDLLVQVKFDPYSDPGHVSGYTIGPLGFDAENVAGLTIDPADNALYLSALDGASNIAAMYRVDASTGTATLTEVLAEDGPRIALAAMTATRPCNIERDVGWLSLSPYAAAPLVAGNSAEVDLFLDARHLAAGVYETHVCVHSNDLQRNKIAIPVRLTVVPAEPTDRIFASGFDPGI